VPVVLPFLFGNLKNFMYIRCMKNIIHKGLENYLIDKDGNVYNTVINNKWGTFKKKIPTLVKSYPNKKTGYNLIVLQNKLTSDKAKAFYVHRLVAECYLPNPLKLPEVNHKDFNKSNNSVENLEWVTKEQNNFHKFSNLEIKKPKFNSIQNNQKKLQKGIEIYKKFGQLKYPAEYWKVSVVTARKLLSHNNIEIYKQAENIVPVYIKTEIIGHIKQNKNLKPRHIKEWVYKQFKLNLNRGMINSLRNHAFSF